MNEQSPPGLRGLSLRRLAAVVGVAVALLVVAVIAIVPRLAQLADDRPAVGGAFSLIDQTGKTVTDADFHGKLMLVYFGYTFCPDVCPTELGVMTQAYDLLPQAAQQKVVPIFITVDPERDTVDQMAEYVSNFSPAMLGLTGSPEQVRKVLTEYRVFARKVDGEDGNYSVDHSSLIYLMGKDGRLVALLPGGTPAKDIADRVRAAL
jgi:protein SCO1/2